MHHTTVHLNCFVIDLHNYANEGGVTDESKTCAHKQESNINIELILLAAPPCKQQLQWTLSSPDINRPQQGLHV